MDWARSDLIAQLVCLAFFISSTLLLRFARLPAASLGRNHCNLKLYAHLYTIVAEMRELRLNLAVKGLERSTGDLLVCSEDGVRRYNNATDIAIIHACRRSIAVEALLDL